jgi:hypothetical protein
LAQMLRDCKLSKEEFDLEAWKYASLVEEKWKSLEGDERKKADEMFARCLITD